MKIDTNAFIDSLPIMGVGLLGIFIVTIVLILGIYLLKAISSKLGSADGNEKKVETSDKSDSKKSKKSDTNTKKESALDLMREREKKDFFKEEESNYISHDL